MNFFDFFWHFIKLYSYSIFFHFHSHETKFHLSKIYSHCMLFCMMEWKKENVLLIATLNSLTPEGYVDSVVLRLCILVNLFTCENQHGLKPLEHYTILVLPGLSLVVPNYFLTYISTIIQTFLDYMYTYLWINTQRLADVNIPLVNCL